MIELLIKEMGILGRKVKCKFCNKEIDKDKAYAVEYLTSSLSLRHHYYCNEECEKKKIEKRRTNKKGIIKNATLRWHFLWIGNGRETRSLL